MTGENADSKFADSPNANFPVSYDQTATIERFRSAICSAGGYRVVSDRSGVPKGTIENLLRGTDIRLSAAHGIAAACNVTLDWLTNGPDDDIRRPGERSETKVETPVKSAAPPRPATLFSTVKMDQFALSLELVADAFRRMNRVAEPRRVAQLATLIYDAMEDGTFATSGIDDLLGANKK